MLVYKMDKLPPHHPFAQGLVVIGMKRPANWPLKAKVAPADDVPEDAVRDGQAAAGLTPELSGTVIGTIAVPLE